MFGRLTGDPRSKAYNAARAPDPGLFPLFPPVTLPVTSHDRLKWDGIHIRIDSQHANLLFTSVEQQETALHMRT